MGLPALSRTDRLLFGILLITSALVALGSWLLAPPEKTGGMERQPSTLFNVAYGAKAGYQVLDRLGYPVARLRRRIEPETLKGIGVLFVLKPWIGLDDHEVETLEEWIKDGHALVVVPGRSSDFHLPGSSLKDWFRFAEPADESKSQAGQASLRHSLRHGLPTVPQAQPAVARSGDRAITEVIGGADIPVCPTGPSSEGRQECLPHHELTAGIKRLVAGGDQRFDLDSPLRGPLAKSAACAFWKDKQGIIGLRAELGDGAVVALADTYPLSNLGINDADNGLLLANLARELSDRYPGQIAFDEYHLGYAERDWSSVAIAKLALGGDWRWAVAQAALVGVLAMYGAGLRFGRPRDLTLKPRRQHREFAEAAGRLLSEAGAVPLAAETLFRYYRDRLCRLVYLGPDADDQRLGQAVRERSGREIVAILAEAQGAVAGRAGRQKLLAVSQQLHRLVEALDHGA